LRRGKPSWSVEISDHKAVLLGRITSHTAVIGVIGLGYAELPLALVFEEANFHVLGFDIDPTKFEALNRGESYIRHIGPGRVADAFKRGRIQATTDFSRLSGCDAILVCVPSPLGRHREPDLTYVQRTAETIAKHMRPGHLAILESTTHPGTTREELVPRFRAQGFTCGKEVFVAFSPEREDPGNAKFHTRNIPKVVGGIDDLSGNVAEALYAAVLEKVIRVSTAEVAESGKLLENIFRSVNIVLVNVLKMIFDKMGIDVWEIIEAAKSKPLGFMPFYPGPGIGGHCIPIDPFYHADSRILVRTNAVGKVAVRARAGPTPRYVETRVHRQS
jgi:UDP-N-acetyl-D-glucosamine dehydrogenase